MRVRKTACVTLRATANASAVLGLLWLMAGIPITAVLYRQYGAADQLHTFGVFGTAISIAALFLVGAIVSALLLAGATTLADRIEAVPSLGREDTRLVRLAPGYSLRRFARFFFSERAFDHVFAPVLSDLEIEYFEALSQGCAGRAKMVRVRGYCSFWQTTLLYSFATLGRNLLQIWKLIH